MRVLSPETLSRKYQPSTSLKRFCSDEETKPKTNMAGWHNIRTLLCDAQSNGCSCGRYIGIF